MQQCCLYEFITILQKFHADRKKKGWTEDDDDHQIIEFADSSIKLGIPSEPINNWRIVPRSHPEVNEFFNYIFYKYLSHRGI